MGFFSNVGAEIKEYSYIKGRTFELNEIFKFENQIIICKTGANSFCNNCCFQSVRAKVRDEYIDYSTHPLRYVGLGVTVDPCPQCFQPNCHFEVITPKKSINNI